MDIFENVSKVLLEISDAEQEQIKMNSELEDFLDSLAIVNFCVKLGKVYGIKIPKMQSVGEVVNYIESNRKV